MGKRSTARRLAMQAIFQANASSISISESLASIFAEENLDEDTIEFARRLAEGVAKNKEQIDKKIDEFSKDWHIDRISLVNKSILSLALYEMLLEKDTPKAVIINEAILLAKRYSDEESARFINGILGSAVV